MQRVAGGALRCRRPWTSPRTGIRACPYPTACAHDALGLGSVFPVQCVLPPLLIVSEIIRRANVDDNAFGISASAQRIRAQERIPLGKLLRSYFSFGEWMLSSSSPKPTSTVSRPSLFLKSATIGIEAPDPNRIVSLPHSSVSARLTAASGFMFQSSAIAGALEWSPNSALQSFGNRAVT